MQQEELYYDHYKDSFEQQKGYIKERDRLTLYLIVLVAVIFLLDANRSLLMDVSTTFQEQKIGKAVVDFKIIASILYFAFMWLSMRYYQINLTIEKAYSYIKLCEDRLSAKGEYRINREGGDYLKNYPWLKWVAHRIYVFLFPLLIIVASIVSIVQECCCDDTNRLINILFLSIVVVLSLLYLRDRICAK